MTVEIEYCQLCDTRRVWYPSPNALPDDAVDDGDDAPFSMDERLAGWEEWVDDLAEMNGRAANDPRATTWTPDDYAGLLAWRNGFACLPEIEWTQNDRDRLDAIDERFRVLTRPDDEALMRMHFLGHHHVVDVWYSNRVPVAGCVVEKLAEWTSDWRPKVT